MRDLDFGGAPMPPLEDFEPYEYTDDNPEEAMDKARQRAQSADRVERPQQEPGKTPSLHV